MWLRLRPLQRLHSAHRFASSHGSPPRSIGVLWSAVNGLAASPGPWPHTWHSRSRLMMRADSARHRRVFQIERPAPGRLRLGDALHSAHAPSAPVNSPHDRQIRCWAMNDEPASVGGLWGQLTHGRVGGSGRGMGRLGCGPDSVTGHDYRDVRSLARQVGWRQGATSDVWIVAVVPWSQILIDCCAHEPRVGLRDAMSGRW